jgi:hypothetical protein
MEIKCHVRVRSAVCIVCSHVQEEKCNPMFLKISTRSEIEANRPRLNPFFRPRNLTKALQKPVIHALPTFARRPDPTASRALPRIMYLLFRDADNIMTMIHAICSLPLSSSSRTKSRNSLPLPTLTARAARIYRNTAIERETSVPYLPRYWRSLPSAASIFGSRSLGDPRASLL